MTCPRSLLFSSTAKNRSKKPDTLALFITSLSSFPEVIDLLIPKVKRAKGSEILDSVWVTWLLRKPPPLIFTLGGNTPIASDLSLFTKFKSSAKSEFFMKCKSQDGQMTKKGGASA